MLVILIFSIIFETTFSNNDLSAKKHLVYTASSDFSIIVQSAAFVDKTLLIKEFLQDYEMIMVTAPRKFGKSTNLDMIKRFCEITVDVNGNRMQRNLTENYKLFSKNSFNIYKNDRAFFLNNFGVYPVIYLDFKQLDCSNYKSFILTFKELVGKTYESHQYLLHGQNLNKEKQYQFERFYYSNNISELEDWDLFYSMETLASILYSFFNRTKCIVLIDEYDGPVREAIFKSVADLDSILYFIRKFISITLKSNKYVGRGLITACVLTASANNIIHALFLTNKKFYKFYGFTEKEVKSLLRKQNMSGKFDDVKMWYDGYHTRNSNVTIYNPFSIANYLYFKKCDKYWVKSVTAKHLGKIFLDKILSSKINQLLLYKNISILTVDQLGVGEIVKLTNIVKKPESWELSENDADLFIQFMTNLGYFNIVLRGIEKTVVEIPNLEIKTEIVNYLKKN